MFLFANGRRGAATHVALRAKAISFLIFISVVFSALASDVAIAGGKFAAIVVDARNGKVLSAEYADARRYPASLTKMMTLYVLFEDLKAGKIKLDSPIRMSARAASMAPSKLGVKPGKSITVETAIRALVVKSANDVAAAIAENLGGTESAFAKRMTRTARSIGMNRTTFVNASGLPNPNQITTARDMATLGLRLMRDFPQYYPYFRAQSFTYAGRTIRGHNRLLGKFEGTDGIKTGYINASGYNLVTSARRGSQRLVGVVMGGRTGNSRNAYMMKILDKHFPKASKGKTIAAIAGSSKGAIDPIGDDDDVETATATTKKKTLKSLLGRKKKDEAEESQKAAATAADEGDSSDDGEDADGTTLYEVDASPQTPATIPQVLESHLGDQPAPKALPFEVKKSPETSEPAQDNIVASAAPAGNWTIQVGAYAAKNDAQARLRQVMQKFPDLFDGRTAFTATVELDQKITYRSRFTGFEEDEAKSTCEKLQKRQTDCYVLAPAS